MIDQIFNGCVWLLVWAAEQLGITYQAINVWIFVILWPVSTVALMAIALSQYRQIRRLRQRLADKP
jgi:hypothetical protein